MIVFLLIIIFIVIVTPVPKIGRFRWLTQCHAHRGLFDDENPENSFGAFNNAIQQGLAIECDVRLSWDKVVMVVHDDNLERLCGCNEYVSGLYAEQLKSKQILGSKHTFIELKTLLELVDGQVPLMIEIKPTRYIQETVDRVFESIKSYHGNVSVISFDPRIVARCKQKQNQLIAIGQIIEVHWRNKSLAWWQRLLLTINAYQRYTNADFVSINVELWPFFQWMTWIGIHVGIWPIKNPMQLKRCNANNIAVLEKEAL